jgi:ABC-type bacteriocin/lantibiotic exporter with double-glycine peptidase domain
MHNENAVSKALSQLKLTRIVIAHRPETIALADRHINFGLPDLEAPGPLSS